MSNKEMEDKCVECTGIDIQHLQSKDDILNRAETTLREKGNWLMNDKIDIDPEWTDFNNVLSFPKNVVAFVTMNSKDATFRISGGEKYWKAETRTLKGLTLFPLGKDQVGLGLAKGSVRFIRRL